MLILVGDFNAKHLVGPFINPKPSRPQTFLTLERFSLSQLVDQPTRYASDFSSSSTLDLVATNRQDLITLVEDSDPFSDHCPVVTELELPRKTPTQRTLLVPNYKQADWEGFHQNLFHSPGLVKSHPRYVGCRRCLESMEQSLLVRCSQSSPLPATNHTSD